MGLFYTIFVVNLLLCIMMCIVVMLILTRSKPWNVSHFVPTYLNQVGECILQPSRAHYARL